VILIFNACNLFIYQKEKRLLKDIIVGILTISHLS